MKLSGLKAGASIRLLAESSEAENPVIRRSSPPRPHTFIFELESSGFSAKEDKNKKTQVFSTWVHEEAV